MVVVDEDRVWLPLMVVAADEGAGPDGGAWVPTMTAPVLAFTGGVVFDRVSTHRSAMESAVCWLVDCPAASSEVVNRYERGIRATSSTVKDTTTSMRLSPCSSCTRVRRAARALTMTDRG